MCGLSLVCWKFALSPILYQTENAHHPTHGTPAYNSSLVTSQLQHRCQMQKFNFKTKPKLPPKSHRSFVNKNEKTCTYLPTHLLLMETRANKCKQMRLKLAGKTAVPQTPTLLNPILPPKTLFSLNHVCYSREKKKSLEVVQSVRVCSLKNNVVNVEINNSSHLSFTSMGKSRVLHPFRTKKNSYVSYR